MATGLIIGNATGELPYLPLHGSWYSVNGVTLKDMAHISTVFPSAPLSPGPYVGFLLGVRFSGVELLSKRSKAALGGGGV